MIANPFSYFITILLLSLIYNLFNIKKLRYTLLFLASFYFYFLISINFLIILIFIITFTYFFAIIIKKNSNNFLFYFFLILILLPLLFYKYLIFFISNNIIYLNIDPNNYIIPIGLSFYTFQAVGYLIDVKRKHFEPEINFFLFSIFIAYFPQLLAGPIEKYQNLFFQIKKSKSSNLNSYTHGLTLIVYGVFLKYCVANILSEYVNLNYPNYNELSSVKILITLYFYAFQIYADFFAYSLIAMGTSYLFGIKITNNFNFPFFSTNINLFWKRWHISLTSWVFNYVYTTLVSSLYETKKINKFIKSQFTLLLTWIIIGVWHGANFTFVIFGILQFIFSQITFFVGKYFNLSNNYFIFRLIKIFLTFNIVAFTFILMKCENIEEYFQLLISLFVNINKPINFFQYPGLFIYILFGISFIIAIEYLIIKGFFKNFYKYYLFKFISINFLIFLIILLGNNNNLNYIYFNF